MNWTQPSLLLLLLKCKKWRETAFQVSFCLCEDWRRSQESNHPLLYGLVLPIYQWYWNAYQRYCSQFICRHLSKKKVSRLKRLQTILLFNQFSLKAPLKYWYFLYLKILKIFCSLVYPAHLPATSDTFFGFYYCWRIITSVQVSKKVFV